MKFNLNVSAVSGVIKRFGIVVYIGVLLITGLIAYFTVENSLSMQFFTAGTAIIGALITLEVIRRTVLFIFAEQNFFKGRVPLAAKVFGFLALVLLLISGTYYYGYEKPAEVAAQKARETLALANYNKAIIELPNLKSQASVCYENAKNKITSQTQTETSYCRSARLGYNSCIEIGLSVTSCLYTYDYKSACSSDYSFALDSAKTICNKPVSNAEYTIDYYELGHPEILRFRATQ
jgi:hypothetical protein